MVKYILKRLGLLLLTLFLIVTLTFFMMQVMPGTPFSNPKLTPDQLEILKHAYGLDKPLWQQYFIYIGHMFTGNFGTSFIYTNQPVITMIAQRLPVSMQLGTQALILGTVLGALMGKASARRKNGILDGVFGFLSVLGISVPSFVIGTLILLYLGFNLNLFPISGWGTFSQTIMPTIALSFAPMAVVTRFVRSEMIESLSSDYILLARAKGLSEKEVVNKHALRNSLIPMLTLIGPMAAGLLTGSVLIEKIFSIPGIGAQFVDSIPAKDFPVIMATTIVYAVILMVFILVTDILTAIVDPRVRL
ncbi:Oligopeptide transport system permease protein OppB [Lactococcus lactis subsp. lactis]|jgi:oligopeptide transport system permease protein|uniref:ABC transporter permease n=2 Tax=Lactococcus lactis TaxID=1358 RepID=A0AAE4NQA3_9LACT|nr:ABC transporter permease [Lactococcus lactis]ATY86950.1 ABC transporter permease [Lactococcus lactis subsp. lactis]ATZ00575.1 ABC transporter permease [Lactococcus lactis subsp. lactis]KST87240.1 Oligopeptide transport system permease protein OppB [Lactococcus lactis subsp. lactis]KST89614.1 Oligopeptide transport system permease protein OppB [Lactococcus lactis subsp. lactis]KST94335.1 Oligopeptide transport system permease protein OppB [Lactococcus lactis subsp. lactis]